MKMGIQNKNTVFAGHSSMKVGTKKTAANILADVCGEDISLTAQHEWPRGKDEWPRGPA